MASENSRKTPKRHSILKLNINQTEVLGSENSDPPNSETTSNMQTKNKRVSFAGTKHIKEFCDSAAVGTVWDNTYEESELNHTKNSQNSQIDEFRNENVYELINDHASQLPVYPVDEHVDSGQSHLVQPWVDNSLLEESMEITRARTSVFQTKSILPGPTVSIINTMLSENVAHIIVNPASSDSRFPIYNDEMELTNAAPVSVKSIERDVIANEENDAQLKNMELCDDSFNLLEAESCSTPIDCENKSLRFDGEDMQFTPPVSNLTRKSYSTFEAYKNMELTEPVSKFFQESHPDTKNSNDMEFTKPVSKLLQKSHPDTEICNDMEFTKPVSKLLQKSHPDTEVNVDMEFTKPVSKLLQKSHPDTEICNDMEFTRPVSKLLQKSHPDKEVNMDMEFTKPVSQLLQKSQRDSEICNNVEFTTSVSTSTRKSYCQTEFHNDVDMEFTKSVSKLLQKSHPDSEIGHDMEFTKPVSKLLQKSHSDSEIGHDMEFTKPVSKLLQKSHHSEIEHDMEFTKPVSKLLQKSHHSEIGHDMEFTKPVSKLLQKSHPDSEVGYDMEFTKPVSNLLQKSHPDFEIEHDIEFTKPVSKLLQKSHSNTTTSHDMDFTTPVSMSTQKPLSKTDYCNYMEFTKPVSELLQETHSNVQFCNDLEFTKPVSSVLQKAHPNTEISNDMEFTAPVSKSTRKSLSGTKICNDMELTAPVSKSTRKSLSGTKFCNDMELTAPVSKSTRKSLSGTKYCNDMESTAPVSKSTRKSLSGTKFCNDMEFTKPVSSLLQKSHPNTEIDEDIESVSKLLQEMETTKSSESEFSKKIACNSEFFHDMEITKPVSNSLGNFTSVAELDNDMEITEPLSKTSRKRHSDTEFMEDEELAEPAVKSSQRLTSNDELDQDINITKSFSKKIKALPVGAGCNINMNVTVQVSIPSSKLSHDTEYDKENIPVRINDVSEVNSILSNSEMENCDFDKGTQGMKEPKKIADFSNLAITRESSGLPSKLCHNRESDKENIPGRVHDANEMNSILSYSEIENCDFEKGSQGIKQREKTRLPSKLCHNTESDKENIPGRVHGVSGMNSILSHSEIENCGFEKRTQGFKQREKISDSSNLAITRESTRLPSELCHDRESDKENIPGRVHDVREVNSILSHSEIENYDFEKGTQDVQRKKIAELSNLAITRESTRLSSKLRHNPESDKENIPRRIQEVNEMNSILSLSEIENCDFDKRTQDVQREKISESPNPAITRESTRSATDTSSEGNFNFEDIRFTSTRNILQMINEHYEESEQISNIEESELLTERLLQEIEKSKTEKSTSRTEIDDKNKNLTTEEKMEQETEQNNEHIDFVERSRPIFGFSNEKWASHCSLHPEIEDLQEISTPTMVESNQESSLKSLDELCQGDKMSTRQTDISGVTYQDISNKEESENEELKNVSNNEESENEKNTMLESPEKFIPKSPLALLRENIQSLSKRSGTIWKIHTLDEKFMAFDFFWGAIAVVIHSKETESTKITDNVSSLDVAPLLVEGETEPAASFVYNLLLRKINTETLNALYHTYEQIPDLLEYVSKEVRMGLEFHRELNRLQNYHLMKFEENRVSFVLRTRDINAGIILCITIEVRSIEEITWKDIDVKFVLGAEKVKKDDIAKFITNVKKDHTFLRNYMSDVVDFIDIKARSTVFKNTY